MAYIGNSASISQYAPQVAYFSGNGSTTAFTLPVGVVSSAQILVFVANVPQNPSSAYTVSGTTLTFTSAPPTGTNNVWVEYTSLQTNTVTVSPGSTIQTPTLVSPITTGSVSQITTYTSGSGTYTVPTNARYLHVTMVGGGGGGAGSDATGGLGGTGGNTTFGTATASGGTGGVVNGPYGGAGGTATLGTITGINITGGNGDGPVSGGTYPKGGIGGSTALGGAGSGAGGTTAAVGGTAKANTGGGGGGASCITASTFAGSGGGAGAYISGLITSPAASYSYSVGAGGTAGTAGTTGFAGGAGGSGVIIVTAFF
jgi:hypothetical protein